MDGIIQQVFKTWHVKYLKQLTSDQFNDCIGMIEQELIERIKQELNTSEYYFGDSHGKIIKKLIGDNKK